MLSIHSVYSEVWAHIGYLETRKLHRLTRIKWNINYTSGAFIDLRWGICSVPVNWRHLSTERWRSPCHVLHSKEICYGQDFKTKSAITFSLPTILFLCQSSKTDVTDAALVLRIPLQACNARNITRCHQCNRHEYIYRWVRVWIFLSCTDQYFYMGLITTCNVKGGYMALLVNL